MSDGPRRTDVAIRGLAIEYPSGAGPVRPIDGFDLDVGDGELVVLLGASGSGKTSLLSAIAAIVTPIAGTIEVGGVDVLGLRGDALTAYRRETIGVVFQAFNLVPSLSAWENVAAPLWAAGQRLPAARERAVQLLHEVNLQERLDHRPAELSGGQQQRVAIARALVQEPSLVLADEPTAHLDFVQVDGIVRLLRAVARPGRSVLVATHDERLLHIADRVVELTTSRQAAAEAPLQRWLAPGEVLYQSGDEAEHVFLVESGALEVLRARHPGRDEVVVRRAGPGDHVGEVASLFGLPRAETARAVEPTWVTGLAARDFRQWIRSQAGPHHPADEG
jgi:putative ABC transport system ATP-binding protein